MKLVKFKKITVQNFLSVGEEPVVINFTKGLNIITGINKDKSSRRNGVGKSTIAPSKLGFMRATQIVASLHITT